MTWCQASSRQMLLCPPKLAWPLSLIGSLQHRGPALSKPSGVSGLYRCPLLLGKTSEALGELCWPSKEQADQSFLSQATLSSFRKHTFLHTPGIPDERVAGCPEWVVQVWGKVKQGVTGRPGCTKFRLMYCYFLCPWTHFTQRAFSCG